MAASAIETPEQVMSYAAEGRLSKHALASLLTAQARRPFLNACAAIEMKYTDDCRALNDPCLESGCSAEGERGLPYINIPLNNGFQLIAEYQHRDFQIDATHNRQNDTFQVRLSGAHVVSMVRGSSNHLGPFPFRLKRPMARLRDFDPERANPQRPAPPALAGYSFMEPSEK